MNFDSLEFLICFLPICLLFYWISVIKKKKNLAIYFLILFSLFFYAWFELKFLALIVGSVLFNYYFSYFFLNSRTKYKKK